MSEDLGPRGAELSERTFNFAGPALRAVVEGALSNTPPHITRRVYDLDHHEILGSAHPHVVVLEVVDGEERMLPVDTIRSWLDPASIGPMTAAFLRCREMKDGDVEYYEATYRPPRCNPFRLSFTCRPFLRDRTGRVSVIVCDIETTLLSEPE